MKSGGTLHIVNKAEDGPHTLSVVKKKDLPRTTKQIGQCKICETIGQQHGADPEQRRAADVPVRGGRRRHGHAAERSTSRVTRCSSAANPGAVGRRQGDREEGHDALLHVRHPPVDAGEGHRRLRPDVIETDHEGPGASRGPRAVGGRVRPPRACATTGSPPFRRPGTSCPTGATRSWTCRSTAADSIFPTVVYRRYTPRLGQAAAQRGALERRRPADPRPADQGARRRPAAHPLQEHGHAAARPALDALPRRALQAELRRRLPAGLLGQGRRRQARADVDLPADAPASDSFGVWPYHDHSPSMHESIAGGMFGMLSILRRHERAPDREFEVVFTPFGKFMAIDGRAFVGNTPVFQSRVGDLVQWDVMAMGSEHHTFHVHGHRWLDAERHPARHADGRAGRELPLPLARGGPRHLVLPLPRRGPHDARHDRHLPGLAAMKRAALIALARQPRSARRPPHADHAPDQRPLPGVLSVAASTRSPATTITWSNVSERTHTVTADDGSFDSGELSSGDTFAITRRRARRLRLPLHDPRRDERRDRRAPRDPRRCCPARRSRPASASRSKGRTSDSQTRRHDRARHRLGVPARRDGDPRRRRHMEHRGHRRRRPATTAPSPAWTPARRAASSCSTAASTSRRRSAGIHVTVTPGLPYGHLLLERNTRERFGWFPVGTQAPGLRLARRFRIRRPGDRARVGRRPGRLDAAGDQPAAASEPAGAAESAPAHLTVSVPFMPAALCAGTGQ